MSTPRVMGIALSAGVQPASILVCMHLDLTTQARSLWSVPSRIHITGLTYWLMEVAHLCIMSSVSMPEAFFLASLFKKEKLQEQESSTHGEIGQP